MDSSDSDVEIVSVDVPDTDCICVLVEESTLVATSSRHAPRRRSTAPSLPSRSRKKEVDSTNSKGKCPAKWVRGSELFASSRPSPPIAIPQEDAAYGPDKNAARPPADMHEDGPGVHTSLIVSLPLKYCVGISSKSSASPELRLVVSLPHKHLQVCGVSSDSDGDSAALSRGIRSPQKADGTGTATVKRRHSSWVNLVKDGLQHTTAKKRCLEELYPDSASSSSSSSSSMFSSHYQSKTSRSNCRRSVITDTLATLEQTSSDTDYISDDYSLALKLNKELNGPSISSVNDLARKPEVEDEKIKLQVSADEKLAEKLQRVEDAKAMHFMLRAGKGATAMPASSNSSSASSNSSSATPASSNLFSAMPAGSNLSLATPAGSNSSSAMPASSNLFSAMPVGSNSSWVPAQGPTISGGSNTGAEATQLRELVSCPMKLTSGDTTGPDGFPLSWTICPNCPPDFVRRYHLIEVEFSDEWQQVASPLTTRGFRVTKVQRIQNVSLWQRFQSERQLMMQNHPDGFSVNETLLYHTSRAEKSAICEEGLDQRLSRAGLFGAGVYFSDDPHKCHQYWSGRQRPIMFACRVLLGDVKVYLSGQCDRSLRREPLKPSAKPGAPKTYDSVQGNMSGQNEFVVYNTYRVLPEYLIEYDHTAAYRGPGLMVPTNPPFCLGMAAARHRSTVYRRLQNIQANLSKSHSSPKHKHIMLARIQALRLKCAPPTILGVNPNLSPSLYPPTSSFQPTAPPPVAAVPSCTSGSIGSTQVVPVHPLRFTTAQPPPNYPGFHAFPKPVNYPTAATHLFAINGSSSSPSNHGVVPAIPTGGVPPSGAPLSQLISSSQTSTSTAPNMVSALPTPLVSTASLTSSSSSSSSNSFNMTSPAPSRPSTSTQASLVSSSAAVSSPVLPSPSSSPRGPKSSLCFLCGFEPESLMCICGLNSNGRCKHCDHRPSVCRCPSYKSLTGRKVPYRCLTDNLQRMVRILSNT